MQNTRLTTLVDTSTTRLINWLQNPWRRISVVILSLLFGFFLATAIATTAGQNASWDIIAGVILAIITEFISWAYYRRSRRARGEDQTGRSLIIEMLNGIKIGLIYGMYIEAFKLGS
ncbi:MAG: DUF565 domain-containing protein [Kaiparowitsia implicata GSE-PSE-MK54-09C]|jgi:ABC-type dipeptide/oligopeptide/nickel transport system permease subunit|nr:DUF565 domain-containing protein [Kaiparowitsia implicata GSE-PSE-MK54-09C]